MTSFREAIDRCIVEHCGIEDSEFIAAVTNDTHVVVANAEPIADAILAMPEMTALKTFIGSNWCADHWPREKCVSELRADGLPDCVIEWVLS